MAQRIGRNTDSESVRGSLNLPPWGWERLQIQVKIACQDIDCTTSWKHIPSQQKSEVFHTLLRLDALAGREDVADWLMHYHWRKRNIVFQAQRRRYSRRMLLESQPSTTEKDERQEEGGQNMESPDRRGRLDFILNSDEAEPVG